MITHRKEIVYILKKIAYIIIIVATNK